LLTVDDLASEATPAAIIPKHSANSSLKIATYQHQFGEATRMQKHFLHKTQVRTLLKRQLNSAVTNGKVIDENQDEINVQVKRIGFQQVQKSSG
jgi:hypothetical protein